MSETIANLTASTQGEESLALDPTPEGSTSTDDGVLASLFRSYRKYRLAVIALSICCGLILIAAMGLYKTQAIDAATQGMMIMSSYVFVVAVLFLAFARVRPIKKSMKKRSEALSMLQNGSKKERKQAKQELEEEPEFMSKEKHPPSPEYRRYRLLWRICITTAVLIMFGAMALIRINPSDMVLPLIVLTSSYIFLAIAVYLETKKLNPMRKKWKAQQKKARKAAAASK